MSFFKKLFGGKSDTHTQNDLLKLFAQRVQSLPNMKQVSIDASQNRITYTTNEDISGSWFVDNIWTQYQQNPHDLESLLNAHARSLEQSLQADEKPLNERSAQFFPVIKAVDWLESSKAQMRELGGEPDKIERAFAYRVLNAELVLAYVEDKPDSIGFLSMDDADALGGMECLHDLAMSNLMQQKVPSVQIQGGDGRYALRADGFFDATMSMALSSFLPHMALQGQPLIAIPSREELLICGDAVDEDVWTLLGMAEDIYAQASYSISPRLFRVHDHGELEPVLFQRYEKDGQRVLNEVKPAPTH